MLYIRYIEKICKQIFFVFCGWIYSGCAVTRRDGATLLPYFRFFLCFVLFISSQCTQIIYLHVLIFFGVASLALGQSYDCPSASEATLKDMGKNNLEPNHNKARTSLGCNIPTNRLAYLICYELRKVNLMPIPLLQNKLITRFPR